MVRNAFAPTLLVLTLLAGSAYAAAKPASKPASAPAAAPPAPAPVVDVKAQNAAKSEAFLAANAKLPGIVTLPSGLQYKIVHSGPANAASPKPGDVIKVNYEGALVDGTVFDSSFQRGKPALMPLGNLVPAWMEALPLMHVGDEWMLYVPPALGYGPEGRGPIPPASVMVFRLQLLGMLSAD